MTVYGTEKACARLREPEAFKLLTDAEQAIVLADNPTILMAKVIFTLALAHASKQRLILGLAKESDCPTPYHKHMRDMLISEEDFYSRRIKVVS